MWVGEGGISHFVPGSPQGVCVAGYGCSGRNEILQLLPPPTLQAKESQGLCPERDFKVECGGFSNRPVYSLKHVPDTRAPHLPCSNPVSELSPVTAPRALLLPLFFLLFLFSEMKAIPQLSALKWGPVGIEAKETAHSLLGKSAYSSPPLH
uniref:WD repeat domain 73 n=1 Tax=Pavo cristatus TaxID=9049 RepID=A0A8C9EUE4_PAVCR